MVMKFKFSGVIDWGDLPLEYLKKGIDPIPKVQAAGFSIFEQATAEGWF